MKSHKSFISRMGHYNNLPYYQKVQSRSMKNQILVTAGTKYKISETETVALNTNDIRKLETVAITQLKFGHLSKYTENVMNVQGGGENYNNDKEILYYRVGNKS